MDGSEDDSEEWIPTHSELDAASEATVESTLVFDEEMSDATSELDTLHDTLMSMLRTRSYPPTRAHSLALTRSESDLEDLRPAKRHRAGTKAAATSTNAAE
jgi:hypothetical protein